MSETSLRLSTERMIEPGALFGQLLLRNECALLRYIMTFIPRRDDAEEVLQQTALVLWERFSDYDREREFLPWAIRFTYFEILNFRKQVARSRLVFREELLDKLVETRRAKEPLLEAQEGALQECLKKFDAESQSLLMRRYCDCTSVASLAKASGRSAKSLYRRFDRIRIQLARCVELRLAQEKRQFEGT